MEEVSGTSGVTLERQDPNAESLARSGRALRRVRKIVLAGTSAVALALVAGFVTFVSDILSAQLPPAAKAEGIVVLTGGSARIDAALHLLSEGDAQRLLISGVNPAVGSGAIADTVDPDLKSLIACCVDLGHEARDTIGNAAETRDWVRQHRYRSLIVVTSAYHMPRTLAELAGALPDVSLTPYPISNPDLHLADWWNEPEAFALLLREYGKYLVAATRLALGAPAYGTPANPTATTSP